MMVQNIKKRNILVRSLTLAATWRQSCFQWTASGVNGEHGAIARSHAEEGSKRGYENATSLNLRVVAKNVKEIRK